MNTEIVWGVKKLELALALDNTGSMGSSNKMTELKKALLNVNDQNGATADGLLETLKKAAKKAGDVKISIIPFDTDVNVGTRTRTTLARLDARRFGTCNKTLRAAQRHKTDCQAINGGTWTTWTQQQEQLERLRDRSQPGQRRDSTRRPDATWRPISGRPSNDRPARSRCP